MLRKRQSSPLSQFSAFLKSNNVEFPHIELKEFAHNFRGVVLTSNVQAKQRLLQIPLSILITSEVARASSLKYLLPALPNLGSQSLLALFLLLEVHKKQNSIYHQWLQLMPTAFRTLPMFFSLDELSLISASDELMQKVLNQQQQQIDEWHNISAAVQQLMTQSDSLPPEAVRELSALSPANFPLPTFVWASLSVGTRVFSLTINGQKTSVLAPLADMCNHSQNSGVC